MKQSFEQPPLCSPLGNREVNLFLDSRQEELELVLPKLVLLEELEDVSLEGKTLNERID